MENIITTVEFASSGIRLVSGYYFHGKAYVLNAMEGENLPFDANGLLETKATEQSLALLINTAKKNLHGELGVVIAILPPDGFVLKQAQGRSTTVDPASRITQIDYANCISMINKDVKTEGKKVIYDNPVLFTDDNKRDYQTFPMGIPSDQLNVLADAHLINKDSYLHYTQILATMGLTVYLDLLAPFCGVAFINSFKAPASYIGLDLEKDHLYLSYVSKNRFCFTEGIKFGIMDGVHGSANELSLSVDKTQDALNRFGFSSDAGFDYQSPEKKSLLNFSSAFSKGFSPIIDEIKRFALDHSLLPDVPVVFYGPGSDIDLMDKFLSSMLERNVYVFSAKVIGARSKVFVDSLGAIQVSSYDYQEPKNGAKRKAEEEELKNTSFGRN
jgi:hypothetical protein